MEMKLETNLSKEQLIALAALTSIAMGGVILSTALAIKLEDAKAKVKGLEAGNAYLLRVIKRNAKKMTPTQLIATLVELGDDAKFYNITKEL